MKINTVTLCSGYDAQCLALERLKRNYLDFDYELIAWAEIDKYAIQAHNALFPQWEDRNIGDITSCDWSKITEDIDLLTYSTPCQSISFAGKQEGLKKDSGTASSIIWSVLNAIDALKPKYLLMENVKALVSSKFIGDFHEYQLELEKRGYTNFANVLNSRDFGCPQNRERIFMVSILGDAERFYFPEPFPLERRLKDVLEKEVDEKYYLSKKMVAYLNSLGGKDGTFVRGKNVDDGNGIAATCTANYYKMPGTATFIKEPIACDMKGHKVYGSKHVNNLVKSGKIPADEVAFLDGYNQTVHTDVSATIKANIDKENLMFVSIPHAQEPKVLQVGNIVKNGNNLEPKIIIGSAQKNAYIGSVEGVSPCINAACGMGGGQTPMILGITVNPNRVREYGDGKLHEDVSMCITSQEAKNTSFVYQNDFRIRKLTERECFRLQGVDDADIDKIQAAGISRSQQYKMAGNSITLDVLYHIFRKLFIEPECESEQLSLF